MSTRIVALLATMAILVVLVVGTASADPVNSKNVRIFDFDCGGEEEVSVATISHNQASVGNVVGSTSSFVTFIGEGTLTFTDPESGQTIVEPFLLTVGEGNRTGQDGELTTCTTTFTDRDPVLGEVTVDVAITGLFTPASN